MTDMTTTAALDQSTAMALLAVTGTIAIVALIIGVLWYIFLALGLYTMAKNRGIKHKWFAWIPYLQNYLFGELIDNHVWGIGGANWILLICPILISYLSTYTLNSTDGGGIFFTIYSVLSLVFYVYLQCAYYRLYKEYTNHAVGFTITTVILPFMAPIFIFISRKNQYKRITGQRY